MIVTVDVDQLAAAAIREAKRWPARSPERRCACHLWSSLITSPTVSAAQRAIRTFGDEQTQADAEQLLGRLATERTEP